MSSIIALFITVLLAFPVTDSDLARNASKNTILSNTAQPETWEFVKTVDKAFSRAFGFSKKSRPIYIMGRYDTHGSSKYPYIDVYFNRAIERTFYLSTTSTDYGIWSGPQDVSPHMPLPCYIRHFFAPRDLARLDLKDAWEIVQRAGWEHSLQDFEVFYDDWPFHQLYYRFQSQYLPKKYVRVGCGDGKAVFENGRTQDFSLKATTNATVMAA